MPNLVLYYPDWIHSFIHPLIQHIVDNLADLYEFVEVRYARVMWGPRTQMGVNVTAYPPCMF